MSEACCKKGLPAIALFGIAFGAGIIGGATLAIILLEVRESLLRSAAARRRGLPGFMLDVASDFTIISDDIVDEVNIAKHANVSDVRTVQGLKTRIRHGGSLVDAEETAEMSALYDAINLDDD